MGDTTIVTPTQIATVADAGSTKVATYTDTAVRKFLDDHIKFYVRSSDGAFMIRFQNGAFLFEDTVGSIMGSTSACAITNAEGATLLAIMKKFHYFLCAP